MNDFELPHLMPPPRSCNMAMISPGEFFVSGRTRLLVVSVRPVGPGVDGVTLLDEELGFSYVDVVPVPFLFATGWQLERP